MVKPLSGTIKDNDNGQAQINEAEKSTQNDFAPNLKFSELWCLKWFSSPCFFQHTVRAILLKY